MGARGIGALTAAIEVIGITKSFQAGRPVLTDIGFTIARGEMVALIGASGSGKSTLIRSIAGLIADRHRLRGREGNGATGSIRILGQPMQEEGRISGAASRLRAHVGVVFQQFNLVPRLSVLTNVCLGLLGQIPSGAAASPLHAGRAAAGHEGPRPRRHRRSTR